MRFAIPVQIVKPEPEPETAVGWALRIGAAVVAAWVAAENIGVGPIALMEHRRWLREWRERWPEDQR